MYHNRPLIDMDEKEGAFLRIAKKMFSREHCTLVAASVIFGAVLGVVGMHLFLG